MKKVKCGSIVKIILLLTRVGVLVNDFKEQIKKVSKATNQSTLRILNNKLEYIILP